MTGVKSYLKIEVQEIRKYYLNWEYTEMGINEEAIRRYVEHEKRMKHDKHSLNFESTMSLKAWVSKYICYYLYFYDL